MLYKMTESEDAKDLNAKLLGWIAELESTMVRPIRVGKGSVSHSASESQRSRTSVDGIGKVAAESIGRGLHNVRKARLWAADSGEFRVSTL